MSSFGLSQELTYYEYELDSAEALLPYSSSEASTDWPNFQLTRPLSDIAGMKILEVQIPFSFYTISDLNNKFIVTSTSGIFTVTIPPANYDSQSLLFATKAALLAVDPAGAYTITFSSLTGKFAFFAAVPFSFTFGVSGDAGDTHPAKNLGFNSGTTITSLVLPAPNVAAINGPTYLYVCSDSLGPLCQVYLPVSAAGPSLSQGGLGPEMAKIPILVNPFDVINWQDPDPEKYFNVQSLFTLQNFDFYLTLGTSFNKPLRLNGLPFCIKLGIVISSNDRLDSGTNLNHLKRIRSV